MPGALHEGIHHGFDLAALPQGIVTGEEQLPVAVSNRCQGMGGGIPVVEFSGEVQLVGAGGPFPIIPAAVYMVEAEVFVSVGKFVQALSLGKDSVQGILIQTHPQINVSGKVL